MKTTATDDSKTKHHKVKGALRKSKRFPQSQWIIVALVVGLGGAYMLVRSFAATATMSLTPATANVQLGANFTASLYVNPGGANSDGVQATITYDPTKLQFVSVDATGSAYSVSLQQSTTTNTITIIRGLNVGDTPVTANALVANLNFKALVGTGTSSLTISNQSISYDGNLTTPTVTGSTVTFVTPPPPSATFSNVSASTIVSTDLSIASGQTNSQLNSSTYTVSLVPTDNSGTGIKQVALQLDGGTALTDTTSPYDFSVNMTGLTCGSHTLTATVTDNQSTPKTGTTTVTFKAARSADVDASCGTIDLSDYNSVRSNFGVSATQLTNPRIDINRNGTVDLSDYSAVRTRYGT